MSPKSVKALVKSVAKQALGSRGAEAAASALARLSRAAPDRHSRLATARALNRLGRVAEAMAATRAVLAEDPGNAEATLLLGRLLQRSGQRDEAIDTIVAVGTRPGASAPVIARAAVTLIRWRLHADVRRLLVGPADDDLDFDAVLAATPERYRDALTAGRAGALLRQERPVDALAMLERVGDLAALDARAMPVALLRKEARRVRSSGDTWLAKGLAELAQSVDPDHEATDNLLKWLDEVSELARHGYPWPPSTAAGSRYTPDPKRVLYLLHNSLPWASAGYATRTHGLLTGVRRTGWEVDGVTRLGFPHDRYGPEEAATLDVPEVEVVDGVPYRRLTDEPKHPVPKTPLISYTERYAHRLEQLVKAERPAILHAASNHWNGIAAGLVARRLGIPYVYEVRGLWEITRWSREPDYSDTTHFRAMSRMEAEAAAGADHCIAITGALRDELVRRGVPAEHVSIVPNGVDTSRFTPQARDEALAAELGMTGKTVIGYVGSLLDYEGLGLLLEAVATLKAERDDFAVLVVGDGTARESLVARARALGVSDLVRFTGRVPHEDVERYYSVVDIAPFPRLPLPVCEMVSPLKPFEAMAMAKTVVVSDVAALSEIVTDGVNGLVHAKGDAGSLTEVLRRLLDDAGLRGRLATAGLEWVRAERDWNVLAARVDEVYREITADSAR